MPVPLSQYLAAVQAAMAPQAIDLDAPGAVPPQTVLPADTITPQESAPAYQSPVGSAAAPAPPQAPQSKYLPPDAFGPGANPIEVGVKLAQSRGDLPADAPAPSAGPTPAQAGPQAPQHPFPLDAVGGAGVIPAHEVDLRGPSLKGAQAGYNEAVAGAIDANTVAHATGAGREYALALEQERGAHERQAAAEQAMAEREEEMAQMQHDFAQSAKALSQFAWKPDGGFWESRTQGQKVAGMFELALNGFMAGAGRPVPSIVMQRIEQSIRNQENAYKALAGTANAQQNAFALAMQKYGNADAARTQVRVAAIEALQAQAAQVAALNKGTDLGARATSAYADLEGQKMLQIQQGIRFLPSQVTGRRFVDQNTGLVYTEQEAKQLADKWYANAAKREEIGLNTAGDVLKEEAKAAHHQAGKAEDEAKFIAEKLQSAGVPQARAAAEQALAALNKSEGGNAEAAARSVLGKGWANKVMSDDRNAREQAYAAFANASMKAMMGNVTASEYERAQDQLGSASDPASRRRAINATLQTLAEVERNIKAGASPAAQATFDQRRETASGGPPVAPKGASQGWR